MFGKPPPKVCELVHESVQTRVFLCHRLTIYKRNEPKKKTTANRSRREKQTTRISHIRWLIRSSFFAPALGNDQFNAKYEKPRNRRRRLSRHLVLLSFYFFVFVGSAIRYMSPCIIIAVHHNLKTKQIRRRAEKWRKRNAHTIAFEFGILFERATGKKILFLLCKNTADLGAEF